jgi:hypothetical protein
MKKMYEEVSTPPALKREKALPKTGDHVIGSPIKSGDVQSVELETTLFMEDILHLKPVH